MKENLQILIIRTNTIRFPLLTTSQKPQTCWGNTHSHTHTHTIKTRIKHKKRVAIYISKKAVEESMIQVNEHKTGGKYICIIRTWEKWITLKIRWLCGRLGIHHRDLLICLLINKVTIVHSRLHSSTLASTCSFTSGHYFFYFLPTAHSPSRINQSPIFPFPDIVALPWPV